MGQKPNAFEVILNEVHSVGPKKDPEIRGHLDDWHASQFAPHKWLVGKGPHFRACSYCGSINPLDLLELSKKQELFFEQADWKYGWPHKLYIRGIGITMAKFYTRHIVDIHNVDGLVTLLALKTGIIFQVKPEGLHWCVPKKDQNPN